MNQTIDMQEPSKCTKCFKDNCEVTWIIMDNNIRSKITTRDCDIVSYTKLPEWIDIDQDDSNTTINLLKTKYVKEIH